MRKGLKYMAPSTANRWCPVKTILAILGICNVNGIIIDDLQFILGIAYIRDILSLNCSAIGTLFSIQPSVDGWGALCIWESIPAITCNGISIKSHLLICNLLA
jgi:hypothetical protein